MDLAQLRTFKAVVDEGGVLGASEKLHCVQSNVTARIRALERSVGVQLFHRQGRRLQLTPSGRTLLDYADRILALSREAVAAVSLGDKPSGDFLLGAIESSATARLPSVLARFHASYPEVRLTLVTHSSAAIIEEIQRCRLDAGLVAGQPMDSGVAADEIYREPLVLVASASAPPIRRPRDLEGRAMLMWPVGCPYRSALERWLSANRIAPSRIVSYSSYGTIVACVGAGAGVSLVPRGVFVRYQKETKTAGYQLEGLDDVPNYFVWHKDVKLHPAREAFLGVLREQANLHISTG